ncbi:MULTISPECIES: hypothetical protein [unclassified Streptomyces]|uniref:hypothetical protein n=1 Tax=unclassified Streptomyces TaxID=2593676 RepID=UPI002E27B769|nr:hypothetical protein [Streptomyces sp. NBC_00223]
MADNVAAGDRASSEGRWGGVPYVARWSGEPSGAMPLVLRRKRPGIAYADERSFDRDERGVLWRRDPSQPGRGQPRLGQVHGLRQRIAMGGLRCQICGGPADRNADGVLWLIDAAPDDPILQRGEERTTHPPICVPCAHRSVRACPHLRTACVALRVRTWTQTGVSGALYQAARPTPVAVHVGTFRYGDPRLPWVLAAQLVMTLNDFTLTDLESPATEQEPTP